MPQFMITSPDGTKYDVTAPDGATEQDALKRVMAEHAPKSDKSEPGFLGRVEGDVEKRFGKMGEQEARNSDPSTLEDVQTRFQQAGQLAGSVGDVAGEAVKSGYNYLPQGARNKIEETVKNVAQTPPGKLAIKALQEGGQTWDKFSKTHPDIADDLSAGFNLATAGIPLEKTAAAAPAIAGKVGEGAEAAGKFVGEGVDTMGHGIKARSGEEIQKVASQAKAQYSPLFKQMKEMGASFNGKASAELLGKITDDLKETGLMDKSLHSKTMGVLKRMASEIPKQGLDLEKLDQYRRLLSGVVKDSRGGEDGFKAMKAIESLDDFVNGVNETHLAKGGEKAVNLLKQARSQWAYGSKVEKLGQIVENAGGSSDKIKSGLKSFLKKDKNLRGFSKDEVDALKKAANSSTSESLLKMLGKFGIDKNHVGVPALVAYGSNAIHSPAGLPLITAGTGARQLNNIIGRGKMEQALKLIESNAPSELEALR